MTKGILYYTDNTLEGTHLEDCVHYCLSKSELPAIQIARHDCGYGEFLKFQGSRSGQAIILQIMMGLKHCDFDLVYLAEHDCLYPPTHFDIETETIAYNTNVYRLGERGLYRRPSEHFPLSTCIGRKEILLDEFSKKIRDWRFGDFQLEPGRGVDPCPVEFYESEQAVVDVRHGSNYGIWKERGESVDSLEHWGSFEDLRDSLELTS